MTASQDCNQSAFTVHDESGQRRLTVLKEGYCYPANYAQTSFFADGSITLVQTGDHTVLVDTGAPCDRLYLIKAFSDIGVALDEVDHVVCSHGHSDHVGNLNLFPEATHIVGWDICKGDLYTSHPFSEGKEYAIAPDLVVMPTPGHTHNDVSLIVKWDKTIIVAGDLFESEGDLLDPSKWKDVSEDTETQAKNRAKILQIADIIVPGHGRGFHVKESYRTSKPD